MDSLLTTQLSWKLLLTEEHVLERPGCSGHSIHSMRSVRSQRARDGSRGDDSELVRVLRVACALDWSSFLAWAGTLDRPGVWEGALGLPWSRSRRGRRNFDDFRIQHGGPSRIHGGCGIHGGSAERCIGQMTSPGKPRVVAATAKRKAEAAAPEDETSSDEDLGAPVGTALARHALQPRERKKSNKRKRPSRPLRLQKRQRRLNWRWRGMRWLAMLVW